MASEYHSIAEALQKADASFRAAERESVELSLENTGLRNKLRQQQREVDDLRLAMQMRERELELEYAQALTKLQDKLVASMAGGTRGHSAASAASAAAAGPSPLAAAAAAAAAAMSGSAPAAVDDSGDNIDALARKHQQQQRQAHGGVKAADGGVSLFRSPVTSAAEQRARQLDEVVLQMHGDSLLLDKQERATREQHMLTAAKLQRDIDEAAELAQVDPGQRRLAALDEKKADLKRLDDAMNQYVAMVQSKRAKLAADQKAVLAEREKLIL